MPSRRNAKLQEPVAQRSPPTARMPVSCKPLFGLDPLLRIELVKKTQQVETHPSLHDPISPDPLNRQDFD